MGRSLPASGLAVLGRQLVTQAWVVVHQGHFQGDTKITGTNKGAGDGDESDQQHAELP